MIMTIDLQHITQRVADGGRISRDEASLLAMWPDLDALCDGADLIRQRRCGNRIDSCSIINARSGLCGEDCKWCAQASRHNTGCNTYNFIDPEEALKAAKANCREGIRRFSLVTSGRRVSHADLVKFCALIKRISEETGLYICASMGLLDAEGMKMLHEAGVKRYHCNMETGSERFPLLCSTHTPQDKRDTIRAAREAGLEVCSGGIIGMGETLEERIDFAFELADLDIVSVPVNILSPIPGTPLQDTPLISEEEIIRTCAMFRFILPDKFIRFAGGRLRVSRKAQERMFRGGVNGVLMGDMLTTVSNKISEDKETFRRLGFDF